KGRRLEELAFEVASKQRLAVPTDKARKLIRRGVRRVFCVLVKQGRLLEWSRETDGWATVPETSSIDDACLVRPLPVAALLRVAKESLFSGLNNLDVFSLVRPQLATYFGFTEPEVRGLVESVGQADLMDGLRAFYNGYLFGGEAI